MNLSKLYTHLLSLFAMIWLSVGNLLAQPTSTGPYQDQIYDPYRNPQWYETPVLWIGLALFTAAIIYYFYWRKIRNREE